MSYNPPGGLKSIKYHVTSIDLLNAIVIGPITANRFFTTARSDNALYDGAVSVEWLDNAGTWHILTDVQNFGNSDNATENNTKGGANWSNLFPPNDPTTPFTLRVKIRIKATQGFCDVTILTE